MLNKKFLKKVEDQILSETSINNNKVYTPFFFLSLPISSLFFLSLSLPSLFFFHCKNVYGIKDDKEIEYVWTKYKEGITSLIDKKELTH